LKNSYVVIMALGMLLVIVAGHIDLSVGSVAGFISALASVMMVRSGMNFLLATVLCLGAFIMGVMNNGMSIMSVGIDWQQVVKGLVLWFECVAPIVPTTSR
jgi:putative multiple sugar transport system permease protein